MNCPDCNRSMDPGWLAMWNPIIGQKIRWQPTKPAYRRVRVPAGAVVVLRAKLGGKDPRPAYRCGTCATIVIPSDAAYDHEDA